MQAIIKLLIMLALGGQGGDDPGAPGTPGPGDDGPDDGGVVVSALQGEWRSGCLEGTIDSRDRFVYTVKGDGDVFEYTARLYQPLSNCDSADLVHTVHYRHTMEAGDNITATDNGTATELDLTLEQITFTPAVGSTTIFNAMGFCGAHDWQAGQAKDITGSTSQVRCPYWYNDSDPVASRQAGYESYGLFRVEGTELLLSTFTDGQRPQSLDLNTVYTRQ